MKKEPFPEGITTMTGQTKVGLSYLTMQLADRMHRGQPTLMGQVIPCGHIMYITHMAKPAVDRRRYKLDLDWLHPVESAYFITTLDQPVIDAIEDNINGLPSPSTLPVTVFLDLYTPPSMWKVLNAFSLKYGLRIIASHCKVGKNKFVKQRMVLNTDGVLTIEWDVRIIAWETLKLKKTGIGGFVL